MKNKGNKTTSNYVFTFINRMKEYIGNNLAKEFRR